MCTFTPREGRKERILRREGKKKSEILGGLAEGGPGKSKPAETTTTTPNPEQVPAKGRPPILSKV